MLPASRNEPPPPGEPAADLPLLWRWFEAWFQRAYQIRPLDPAPECLLAFNVARHRGPAVSLSCGTVVHRGDLILELHFRRAALLPLIRDGEPARMGLGLVRLGDRDIPRLAALLATDPALREVRAVHALTLFHRGVSRYGFEVHPVTPPPTAWWFTAWHRLLLARDHARGAGHVREFRRKLVTRHAWCGKQALIRRCATMDSKRKGPEETGG